MPIFGKKTAVKKEEPVPPAPAGFGHRTPEQIQEALGAAQEARKLRSVLMRDIRAGKVDLQDIFNGSYSDNPVAQNMPVRTLLKNLRGVGPARANKIINSMDIIEGRRVRGLGVRQRRELLEWRSQNMPAEGE